MSIFEAKPGKCLLDTFRAFSILWLLGIYVLADGFLKIQIAIDAKVFDYDFWFLSVGRGTSEPDYCVGGG